MINNEFHLIGMCISDFEKLNSKKFAVYTMRLEVEKYTGNVFEIEVVIYSSNNKINTSKSYLGKQIAVNGFIDTFKIDDGSVRTKLVVQNIMELSKAPKLNRIPQSEVKTSPSVVEDDLPF